MVWNNLRALFVCLLLLGNLGGQNKPGVERWEIKTLGPMDSSAAVRIALSDLLEYPNAENVTRNDKRYKTERIPASVGGKHREGQLVRTTGWLWLVGGESDGDYHIQISASPDSGDHCIVVEVPFGGAPYVADDKLWPKFEAVRTFIKTKLLKDKEPSVNGSLMQHPPYVTVTGVLFYDDSHVGDRPRGKKGMKAATLWELHPVTAIAFAPLPKVTGSSKTPKP